MQQRIVRSWKSLVNWQHIVYWTYDVMSCRQLWQVWVSSCFTVRTRSADMAISHNRTQIRWSDPAVCIVRFYSKLKRAMERKQAVKHWRTSKIDREDKQRQCRHLTPVQRPRTWSWFCRRIEEATQSVMHSVSWDWSLSPFKDICWQRNCSSSPQCHRSGNTRQQQPFQCMFGLYRYPFLMWYMICFRSWKAMAVCRLQWTTLLAYHRPSQDSVHLQLRFKGR